MISIVTISMNQGGFLPAAVDSVLSQRNVDLEYIIVDAGSIDGSRNYLATLTDSRVRLLLEPDEGPADGLNKGVRSTTGTVVGYLNADDVYLAGALHGVDDVFRRMPDIDVLYGDGWIVDAEGRVVRHFESTPWGLRPYLFGAVSVLQPSTFFRRETFDGTAGFNTRNVTCWDGELLVDMALSGAKIQHIRADCSAFRLHTGSISGSGRLEKRYREDLIRVRAKALAGEPGAIDGFLRLVFRGAKFLRSPGYVFRRLGSRPRTARRLEIGPGGYVVGLGPKTA